MPDIEVTEDQRERIRELEEELAELVVGKYGTVRPRDAVEYLLDRYEYDGQVVPGVVEENGGSTSHDGEGASDEEDADETEDGDGEDGEDAEDDEAESEGEEAEEDADDADDDEDDEDADDADDADDDEDDEDADDGGDEQMLNAMMSLLDEHDDKWGEGSGDDRYEVELPDGETEAVRTKDDVRALLFKHYR